MENKLLQQILKLCKLALCGVFLGTPFCTSLMAENKATDKILLNSGLILNADDPNEMFTDADITGRVTATDGEGLPGVNVIIKGTSTGTVTDINGNFTLSTPNENTILVFSFVGYLSQEVVVGTRTSINVVLEEDVTALESVVVIGYGTQDKKEVTSSVASIQAKDFNQGNVNSPAQLLQGKVAGLAVARPGGNPNEGYNIRLRGLSTFGANTEPLVVIDGFIGGDLGSIDPNDIASIDILKDGGAAAIYGTRGSSGVILVTTKKGEADQTHVRYQGYTSLETRARTVDVANREQFLSFGGNDLGSNTDWFDEVSQDAISHVHNLSASGGLNNTSYRMSMNYRDVEGIQKRTGFDQINGRLLLEQSAVDGRLNLTGILGLTRRNSDLGLNEAFRYATIFNPTAPVRNSDGTFFEIDGFDIFNPVAINNQINESTSNIINFALKADYELIDGLTVGVYYGQQTENLLGRQFADIGTKFVGNGVTGGFADRNSQQFNTELVEATITYDHDFGDLSMRLLGGTAYQKYADEGFRVQTDAFTTPLVNIDALQTSTAIENGRATVTSFKRETQISSLFARVNFIYRNSYFFSATIRPEQHDRFGENNRWGTFAAVSGGVNLTDLTDMGPFTFFKLRASWGLTGSIPRLDLVAPSQATLGRNGNGFNGVGFGPAYVPQSNANPNLKWEEKSEVDIGFDFEILDGKLVGTFDYYTRTTSDLLRFQNVPVPPNLFGQTLLNVGEVKNSGVEFAIGYETDLGPDLIWRPQLNFATFSTKLEALETEETQFSIGLGSPGLNAFSPVFIIPGEEVGQIFAPAFLGVNADGTWNVPDLTVRDNWTVAGNGLPDFNLNFVNTFNYKNWDLNFLLRGSFGHSLVNTFRTFYENPGVAATYNVLASSGRSELSGLTTGDAAYSDFHVEKADFVKLDNLTLGFTPSGLSESTTIRSLRLYVSVQNLFVITGYEGTDPEVIYSDVGASDNGGTPGNIENPDPLSPGISRRNAWFDTRTYTVGVSLGL